MTVQSSLRPANSLALIVFAACGAPTAPTPMPLLGLGLPSAQTPTRVGRQVQGQGSEMVQVPGGTFCLGTNSDLANTDEMPERWVDIAAFQLDRREVSVAEFQRCVSAGACDASGTGTIRFASGPPIRSTQCNGPTKRLRHPMNCVTWFQAADYCKYVRRRLPREAEWEKAAKGATDCRLLPWGGTSLLVDMARRTNLADASAARRFAGMRVVAGLDDGYSATAPVGSFPRGASPYGADDMLGNVAEWTEDVYAKTVKLTRAKPFPPARNAGASAVSSPRIVRGAAWNSVPGVIRLTRRTALFPSDRFSGVGFRCAGGGLETQSP